MPMTTWLGGSIGTPNAVRRLASTMTMRTKPVISIRIEGRKDMPASKSSNCTLLLMPSPWLGTFNESETASALPASPAALGEQPANTSTSSNKGSQRNNLRMIASTLPMLHVAQRFQALLQRKRLQRRGRRRLRFRLVARCASNESSA
ncbi:MAG: hypothetical protein R2873_33910 [Caldilineaceae bacterium]